jgi:hypothetical protein
MTKPKLNQMKDKIEFPQIKNMKKKKINERGYLYISLNPKSHLR